MCISLRTIYAQMASIIKHKTGWRAQVCVDGRRKSKVFDTKGRAKAWSEHQEKSFKGWTDPGSNTLGDAFKKYSEEVSPTKKGCRWEQIRLAKLQKATIADIPLADLTPAHLALWRDKRLQEVSAGSVRREMALMAGVMSYCTKEWGYLADSPLRLVRKPVSPQPRFRRISADEEKALLQQLPQKLRAIFLLALETAMRLGEICSVRPHMVHPQHLLLEDTKNGTRRHVPLSRTAGALLSSLDNRIDVSPAYVSREFGLACKRAGIKDLHFHDSRREALTRLSTKLNVMELSRMSGHRDLKSLMIYYQPTPAELAEKLG